jgi:hypothetical protein
MGFRWWDYSFAGVVVCISVKWISVYNALAEKKSFKSQSQIPNTPAKLLRTFYEAGAVHQMRTTASHYATVCYGTDSPPGKESLGVKPIKRTARLVFMQLTED